jgi:hypothetical protein
MHKELNSAEAMELGIKNSDQQYPGTHLAFLLLFRDSCMILEYILIYIVDNFGAEICWIPATRRPMKEMGE